MSKKFYFVKAEPPAAAAAPVVPSQLPADPVELAFWDSARAVNECESIRAYLRRYPDGRFLDLALINERRLCRPPAPEPVYAPAGVPRPSTVAPLAKAPTDAAPPNEPDGLPPAPAPDPVPPAAPGPSTVGPTVGPVATAPADAVPSAPVPRPAVDVVEIGRKLQKELKRVGCAANGIENDGTWGTGSRNALRSFIEQTHAVAVLDRPTREALEVVQAYTERVCPLPKCEPGTELRGERCVEVKKERDRHAARPPERERDRSPRGQRVDEPRRVDAGPRAPTREENQQLDPKKGESWFYQGGKRCKTYQPMGETPRIICP